MAVLKPGRITAAALQVADLGANPSWSSIAVWSIASPEDQLPEEWQYFTELNADHYRDRAA